LFRRRGIQPGDQPDAIIRPRVPLIPLDEDIMNGMIMVFPAWFGRVPPAAAFAPATHLC
jgi:hypothetical protein